MEALQELASVDLLKLCNEAKVEHCRATRDLSSCGRDVQHVLIPCGHASLCAECSQRCDVCPICRTSLGPAGAGQRIRQRLYYKCNEAGLIRKLPDGISSQGSYMDAIGEDGQRLFSLFDVALQNNLVSLICHCILGMCSFSFCVECGREPLFLSIKVCPIVSITCSPDITDVCMDENAVSSDPVRAYLLDEVVIKDWCKQTILSFISELSAIYKLEADMKEKLPKLKKISTQLKGICDVLQVMVSSFGEAFSAKIDDLHELLESTLKAKQHLEVILWCTRHQFLKSVQTRYTNFDSWRCHVLQRKEESRKRTWPKFSSELNSELFIEEALQNLGFDRNISEKPREEVDIFCLQDHSPFPLISSGNAEYCGNYYPFDSIRSAADLLFLHGTSDMVLPKQAILLYYLFDRHWTKPEEEWMYLVNDFAATFDISTKVVLECQLFCLLDDYLPQSLEAAYNLLPKISSKDSHPKISQILLEHQQTDVALSVLRCTGRDYFTPANIEDDITSSLQDAVSAVRVRISHGLLTEAFMYQRNCCSKVKEHPSLSKSTLDNFVETLVCEICNICIHENIVDRMIELPWNSEEEKHIHKCLYEYACRMPSTIFGSLLVVFYLQRYRYSEAFEVHRIIQNIELTALDSADENIAEKIQPIIRWRQGLIEKCIELLPAIERDRVTSGRPAEDTQSTQLEMQIPTSIFTADVLKTSTQGSPKKKSPFPQRPRKRETSPSGSSFPVLAVKVRSILQQPLDGFGSPVFTKPSSYSHEVPSAFGGQSKTLNLSREQWRVSNGFDKSTDRSIPMPFHFGSLTNHPKRVIKDEMGSHGVSEEKIKSPSQDDMLSSSTRKRESGAEQGSFERELRWRSDDASDDDDDSKVNGRAEAGAAFAGRRRARFLRR